MYVLICTGIKGGQDSNQLNFQLVKGFPAPRKGKHIKSAENVIGGAKAHPMVVAKLGNRYMKHT